MNTLIYIYMGLTSQKLFTKGAVSPVPILCPNPFLNALPVWVSETCCFLLLDLRFN